MGKPKIEIDGDWVTITNEDVEVTVSGKGDVWVVLRGIQDEGMSSALITVSRQLDGGRTLHYGPVVGQVDVDLEQWRDG